MTTIDIARLMRPRSVAIVGISPEPSSAGFLMLKTLEEYRYEGDIHLVSRNRSEVNGRPCVKTIEDLPDGVDAAMLLIPRVAIEDAVRSCAKKGVGAIVIFSAGFGEAGGEWKEAQDRIAAIAEEAGIALCGPNCLGLVDFINRVPLTFSQQLGPPLDVASGVAVVAQSGGLAGVVRVALRAKGIPVTCWVSTGNEAVLGLEDYAGYLIEQKTTQVVACFAEQIRKPQKFLDVAARARVLGKPIVLLHAGRSAAAQESAKSHTGAMVGNYAVMQTVLAPRRVLQVDTHRRADRRCPEQILRFPVPPTKGCADGNRFGRGQRHDARPVRCARPRSPAAVASAGKTASGRVAGIRRCLQSARPDGASDHPPRNVRPAPSGRSWPMNAYGSLQGAGRQSSPRRANMR